MQASKRLGVLIVAAACLVSIIFVSSFRRLAQGTREPGYMTEQTPLTTTTTSGSSGIGGGLRHSMLHGATTATALSNETAKAELGRAAWRLFHTVFARFPDAPTADEQDALEAYVYLFARLYPCGECADHFQQILQKYPPQVTNRNTAAAWGCHVHNVVNTSLGKEVFDCADIGEWYDCGCAEDEEEEGVGGEVTGKGGTGEVTRTTRIEAELEDVPKDEREPVALDREDWQRGG